MTKAELRRAMRQDLRMLGTERVEKSRAITAAIAAHPAFARAKRIALFSPLLTEPDVERLWQGESRAFCYPRVRALEIEFVEVRTREELAPAAWNAAVREPRSADARIIRPAEIDVLLVPGLAFTHEGQRLGRGGGFYDRYLAQIGSDALILGVCFDLQIVAHIPAEPHDLRVDLVATESGCFGPSA